MHDSMMAQIGMDHEHHNGPENGFGTADGWAEMASGYPSSQNQSPMYEHGGFGFMQPMNHGLPTDPSFHSQRISQPPPIQTHQQLLPLIMPSHPTWPSMLTNSGSYSAPPVAMAPAVAPLVKGNSRANATHGTSSPRKTLTDKERRRMCEFHEANPTVKQTEIGAMFGVERSTVSKVLRQREKYLFPEDRSLSPVKRTKGKFPDIEKALSVWVKNNHKKGLSLSDAAITEQAQRFATGVNHNEGLLKLTSASWLEKFKQKNGIGTGKLTRRASETNIPDRNSLNPDSAGPSASQTPNGISPTSPNAGPSPSTLSAAKSEEDLKSDSVNNYFAQGNGGYRHSNSQSTTSLSSAFTDTAPSPFSGGPTSPTTPFTFSPETNSGTWMPSQQSRIPPQGSNFQRPRSQTFPMLGNDPSFVSPQTTEPITPKYLPVTAPSSALDSPMHEMAPPFGMDATLSPQLHHSSSNGSMGPPASTTPISGLQSPPGSSAPSSPTPEDARRALDTLLNFFQQAPNGLVDQNDYMAVLKLTEKLRLQSHAPLPGGLHRIAEQDGEHSAPKMEQSMSAGC